MSKMIRVKDDTYNKLVEIGRKNETFDDIVRRLIECCRKQSRTDQ